MQRALRRWWPWKTKETGDRMVEEEEVRKDIFGGIYLSSERMER